MQPERWQQIDQLFHLALEQEPGRRAVFLSQACAGDDALQSDVEELISSHEQAKSFIETPATDLAAEFFARRQPGLKLGEAIGPYQVASRAGHRRHGRSLPGSGRAAWSPGCAQATAPTLHHRSGARAPF